MIIVSAGAPWGVSMMYVQDILTLVAKAYGKNVSALCETMELWTSRDAREGYVSKRSWQEYPAKARTRASLDFVLVVHGYLEANNAMIVDHESADLARNYCAAFVRKRQKDRFRRYLDPDLEISEQRIVNTSGIYSICRFGTSTREYCQELLVLRIDDERHVPTNATYIARDIVLRGPWHYLGNTLYTSVYGYRRGHKPHCINVFLAANDGDFTVLGGALGGITTANSHPVVMPAIAIKIDDHSEEMMNIGDASDEYIIREFCKLSNTVEGEAVQIFARMARVGNNDTEQARMFVPHIVTATHRYVAELNGHPSERMIIPGISAFCKQKHTI
jgi:hypothetical protein